MTENAATRTVIVSNPTGLHMRRASAISKLVSDFQSKIDLVKDGHRANTTEPLEILLLAAECGSHLVIEAVGPDAEEAVDALAKLFADDFGLKG